VRPDTACLLHSSPTRHGTGTARAHNTNPRCCSYPDSRPPGRRNLHLNTGTSPTAPCSPTRARRIQLVLTAHRDPPLAMSNSLEAKIVVLGSQGVGKTSLVHRYVKNAFTPPTTQSTIGASFLTKRVVDIDTSTVVRLQIWDTAGQERFRSISKLYYRGMSPVAHVTFHRPGTLGSSVLSPLSFFVAFALGPYFVFFLPAGVALGFHAMV